MSLAQVLQEIGAQVGFVVVDAASDRQLVMLAIEPVPVEALLRQLLRDEDHVLVYGDPSVTGQTSVEKVLLLGHAPSSTGRPSAPGPGDPSPRATELDDSFVQVPAAPPLPLAPATALGQPPWGSAIAVRRTGIPFSDAPLAGYESSPGLVPVPDVLKQHILDRVRALVDSARQATLDRHGGR